MTLPTFKRTAREYQSWNTLTAECYKNKMHCANCSNVNSCTEFEWVRNPYNIRNIKYAVLMTYSNIGAKGIELYFAKLAKN